MPISPQFGCQPSSKPQFSGVRRQAHLDDLPNPEKGEQGFTINNKYYIADGHEATVIGMMKEQAENVPHKVVTLRSAPEDLPPIELYASGGIDMDALEALKTSIESILGRWAKQADAAEKA